MSKLNVCGNFLNSTNEQILGSLNVKGYNGCYVDIHTRQQTTTTPTPTYTLNVYKSNKRLEQFTNPVSNNIAEMELYKSVNLKCNVSSKNGGSVNENNDYHKTIKTNCNFLVFTISNPSVADFYYTFCSYADTSPIDNYLFRDKIIDLHTEALLVKNVSDYKTEVQNGQQKGLSAWSMRCKGNLTNTEYLLYDDALTTMGYFDTSGAVHKANQIVVKSTSSNDAVPNGGAGLGARSVKITGLNATFGEVDETIFLNGTTEVWANTQMTDVNFAEVVSAGDLYCNAGTITIYNTDTNGGTASNPMCSIPMNYGLHENPQYTVPLGYTLIIHKISVVSHCEDECELTINRYRWGTNDTNIVKHRLKTYHLHSNSSWDADVIYNINEKERFTITAQVATTPTGINRVCVNVFGYLKLNSFTASSQRSDTDTHYIQGKDTLPITLP